jgi:hypothetical protein
MVAARGVDNFLTFLSELLALLFRERPETLRSSEQQVKVAFVLQHNSMEELTEALGERRVEQLAYAGMRELADRLDDQLGFQLFETEDELRRAIEFIEARNLIVHNRGIVNRTYISRVPWKRAELGERVTLGDVVENLLWLRESVASPLQALTNGPSRSGDSRQSATSRQCRRTTRRFAFRE